VVFLAIVRIFHVGPLGRFGQWLAGVGWEKLSF
jgi:hypothetical protein